MQTYICVVQPVPVYVCIFARLVYAHLRTCARVCMVPCVSVEVCARAYKRVSVCMVHVLVPCIHVCISALCLCVHIYMRGACSFVYTSAHVCMLVCVVCTRVYACVSACVCWKQGVLSPFLSCPSPPLLLQLVPLFFRTLLRDKSPGESRPEARAGRGILWALWCRHPMLTSP